MAWSAKPSGGYTLSSAQGTGNINEINTYLSAQGYTLEAVCGVCGNMISESALNPWRWQSDTVNMSGGYGLFQYTPASGYINGATGVQYYAPNLSTSAQTTGALATDGIAQLYVMDTNMLGKWVSTCWRSYWDKEQYPNEWNLHNLILNTYGDGEHINMTEFRLIPYVYHAVFAFLACFEGPANLHLQARYENAIAVYRLLTGQDPPEPTPTERKRLPIWMMIKYHI